MVATRRRTGWQVGAAVTRWLLRVWGCSSAGWHATQKEATAYSTCKPHASSTCKGGFQTAAELSRLPGLPPSGTSGGGSAPATCCCAPAAAACCHSPTAVGSGGAMGCCGGGPGVMSICSQ